MTIHKELIKETPEWLAIRNGKPTASNFDKIVTAAKCGLSKSADDFINDSNQNNQ